MKYPTEPRLFIRNAFLSDLDDLTEQAKNFFRYAKFERYGWAVDDDTFKDLMRAHIESDDCIVLCLVSGIRVVGGIAGGTAPFTYDRNKKMALELYYWVEPGFRGITSIRMFNLYEKRLKAMGVDYSITTLPDTDLAEKVGRYYEKQGYERFETHYVKSY